MTIDGYLREQQVLEIIPVSRTMWWEGVRAGRFPKPMKLAPRTTVWRMSQIKALAEKIASPEYQANMV